MVKNTNDIYKLIKSPVYVAKFNPLEMPRRDFVRYELFNTNAPHERISVKFDDKFVEIRKVNNMNSEYYEKFRHTNKRGKKTLEGFKELLFNKELAAMAQYINSL